MNKVFKLFLLILILVTPLTFYKYFHKTKTKIVIKKVIKKEVSVIKPKVAIIFDDLGENLRDFKEIYSLNIPVTVSIVPGLKFSKNIAQLTARCGFSVMIHLPLEPKNSKKYLTSKYTFISASLSKKERDMLMRYYLNYVPLAIAVNNHMGSEATENPKLMKDVLTAVKNRGLFFVDSRTSRKSVACDVAKAIDLSCGYNEGFFDSLKDISSMESRLRELVNRAKDKGKIIIIAHPKKNTFLVFKNLLPELEEKVQFITIKDYFMPEKNFEP